MATHSSVLAWRIPGTAEPGGLPSMGSHRVRHDWSDLAAAAWVSHVAPLVKNSPAMQETWVWSLGWEDPLEKGKATHSSILFWRIPWISPWVAKSQTRQSNFHFILLHTTFLYVISQQYIRYVSLYIVVFKWVERIQEKNYAFVLSSIIT